MPICHKKHPELCIEQSKWVHRAVPSFWRPHWHLVYSRWSLYSSGSAGCLLLGFSLAQESRPAMGSCACKGIVAGWTQPLAPCTPFSLHGLVRVYYFLNSNCCFQVIISLQRENNIGSYVISTSMNLEVIMEWVDFFPSLKRRKINLRLFAYGWEYLWTIPLVSSSHILPTAFVCGTE